MSIFYLSQFHLALFRCFSTSEQEIRKIDSISCKIYDKKIYDKKLIK